MIASSARFRGTLELLLPLDVGRPLLLSQRVLVQHTIESIMCQPEPLLLLDDVVIGLAVPKRVYMNSNERIRALTRRDWLLGSRTCNEYPCSSNSEDANRKIVR